MSERDTHWEIHYRPTGDEGWIRHAVARAEPAARAALAEFRTARPGKLEFRAIRVEEIRTEEDW